MIIEGKFDKWEVCVGLEVHCRLNTKTKLFSRSSNEFGAAQNNNVSFFDAGLPGMLPVINEFAVKQAIKTGIGLNAEFNKNCYFDRKNYFYPDLPLGYQITQFFCPIIKSGYVEIAGKKIRIHDAHLEQDAGKSLHDQHPTMTFIDLNRAGAPLLEIVSEPDIRSPEEAMEYLRNLRTLLKALDTSDADMEKGSMRCDANVSVRKVGSNEYGIRCEIKNMNSISNVGIAITTEANRQVDVLENGDIVYQETRGFNANDNTTYVMRSKEDAIDYRYFPDPDLSPLNITDEMIENIIAEMPELPKNKKKRYIEEYNLSEYDAGVLTSSSNISSFFENLVKKHAPKIACNWLTNELLGRLNKLVVSIEDSPISADMMSELLDLIEDNSISGKIAKDVLDIMIDTKKSASAIVNEKGLKQVVDNGAIEKIADEIIINNQKQVAEYKNGNKRLFGFFIGQAMKLSGGKVNPQVITEILKNKLSQK
ncbi:MAG: Asp-tRNA(Asn)/Glu-tRNA(Gln) amidotransferase subunit GatB [Rickettsiales bacterium]|jgi:aspartyl-tRNA(Asn)/glutamyl-tRNA(Gln) amidotransferase subunit B|nr:Asp-tRNA(Asn)/Glu-tRNA(Gln) amidotransferase subunit GatB [Rickettsiales bacterium]